MIIYRIYSKHTTKSYVGATTQPLSNRISCHRSHYRRWLKGIHKKYCSSYEILKLGLDDIEYECLETTDDSKRECYWISQYDCVNIMTLNFSDRIKEYQKQYRIDNRDKINAQNKQYKIDNRDELNAKKKEKIPCDICSKLISKNNLSRHKRGVHKITN